MRVWILALIALALGAGVARAEDAAGFAFKEHGPGQLDVLQDGRIAGRYQFAHDPATPAKRAETYKTYLHVFDAAGEAPITKGPGGDYTHHRGIFIGWMKIACNGKTYDRWHMKGGDQIHQTFAAQQAGADSAVLSSVVHWMNETNQPLLEETRTMTFRRAPAPGCALIDLETKLTAVAGDLTLDGDPEHAGIQFRPAQEVDRAQTVYTFPGAAADPKKDRDLAWLGETFTLKGKAYSVVAFNHPANPTGTRASAYRDYGRFGYFPVAPIKKGETLTLKYRFWVAEGAMPSAAAIQAVGNAFTGQDTKPGPVTVKPADKAAPPKPKAPAKEQKPPATAK